MIRRRCLVFAFALFNTLAHAAGPEPQRIVSLNLCTDQILLLLVAPERIRMLSQMAADPLWSWQAERAAAIRRFDGSVESVMSTQPDLILAGSMVQVEASRLLLRLGYRVQTLEMPESIDAGLSFITQVAELVGATAAGARLRRDTERRLAVVRSEHHSGAAPRALIYLPNGMSPGPGSLKHELLLTSGFINLAAERGITGYGSIAMEELLTSAPRLLVLEAADLQHASLAQQLLRHPALAGRIATRTIPSALCVCGGPEMADAAETLLGFRRELDHDAESEATGERQ